MTLSERLEKAVKKARHNHAEAIRFAALRDTTFAAADSLHEFAMAEIEAVAKALRNYDAAKKEPGQ